MTIDPCCGGPLPTQSRPPATLTRRRMLVAGAAGAGALVLKGVPTGAQSFTGGEPAGPTGSTTTTTAPAPGPDSLEGTLDGQATARDFGFDPPYPASYRDVRPIMFPILGAVSWVDTYLAPRGGGRRHEGQDLMSAKMNKLLACIDGVIVELRYGSSNSLYLRGDDGYYYCYLHINNDSPGTDNGANRYDQAFGPGIAEGVRVTKGQHIAFVGDSGNAEGSGSHCHFEIRKPNARWYQAAAINARYSLDAAEPAREGGQVPPETFWPWDNAEDLIERHYRDMLGRNPTASDLSYWGDVLNSGQITPHAMMQVVLTSAESDDRNHCVARLYEAYFLRRPDISGFDFWTEKRGSGWSLRSISEYFAQSSEFTRRYGSLSNGGFIDRIYRNVLGRNPDPGGKAFWTSKLDGGESRGEVMLQFSESPENRFIQNWAMQVIVSHGCMLRRMPSADEVNLWTELFRTGQNSVLDMVAIIRMSDEYRWITATTS